MIARNPDGFDRFRRAYIAEALLQAADAMPNRKRRAFRRFLQSQIDKDC